MIFMEILTQRKLCGTNPSLRLIPQYNFQMNKPTPKIYRTTNELACDFFNGSAFKSVDKLLNKAF